MTQAEQIKLLREALLYIQSLANAGYESRDSAVLEHYMRKIEARCHTALPKPIPLIQLTRRERNDE